MVPLDSDEDNVRLILLKTFALEVLAHDSTACLGIYVAFAWCFQENVCILSTYKHSFYIAERGLAWRSKCFTLYRTLSSAIMVSNIAINCTYIFATSFTSSRQVISFICLDKDIYTELATLLNKLQLTFHMSRNTSTRFLIPHHYIHFIWTENVGVHIP